MQNNSTNLTSKKTFPCPNCDLPIQQGNHWNETLCYHALKRRIVELEAQTQAQHNQLIDLITHVAHSQQSDVRHNFSVMNFQFGKAKLAISIGNSEEAFNAGKTLTSAGIEILKYLGYWEIERDGQKELDKEVAQGLTKGS